MRCRDSLLLMCDCVIPTEKYCDSLPAVEDFALLAKALPALRACVVLSLQACLAEEVFPHGECVCEQPVALRILCEARERVQQLPARERKRKRALSTFALISTHDTLPVHKSHPAVKTLPSQDVAVNIFQCAFDTIFSHSSLDAGLESLVGALEHRRGGGEEELCLLDALSLSLQRAEAVQLALSLREERDPLLQRVLQLRSLSLRLAQSVFRIATASLQLNIVLVSALQIFRKIVEAMHQLQSHHRLLLTGTPIQNKLEEFWAVVDWATEGRAFGSLSNFSKMIADPIAKGLHPKASEMQVLTGNEARELLSRATRPILLQRKKKEQPQEELKLPEKQELVLWVNLSSEQRKIYQNYIQSTNYSQAFSRGTFPVEVITYLKTLCRHPLLLEIAANRKKQKQKQTDDIDSLSSGLRRLSVEPQRNNSKTTDDADDFGDYEVNSIIEDLRRVPSVKEILRGSVKLRVLVKLINSLMENGHRTLVFSQSKLMLQVMEMVFEEFELSSFRIDGSTSPKERQAIIDRFNDTSPDYDGPRICLLTTKACGCGITLTGADRVIIFDPSWNPAEDRQAVDRAYRIGQTKPVIVYRMIQASCVEEKVYEKQVFKEALRVIGEKGIEVEKYFAGQAQLQELLDLGPDKEARILQKIRNQLDMLRTDGIEEVTGIVGCTRHDELYREHDENSNTNTQSSGSTAAIADDWQNNDVGKKKKTHEKQSIVKSHGVVKAPSRPVEPERKKIVAINLSEQDEEVANFKANKSRPIRKRNIFDEDDDAANNNTTAADLPTQKNDQKTVQPPVEVIDLTEDSPVPSKERLGEENGPEEDVQRLVVAFESHCIDAEAQQSESDDETIPFDETIFLDETNEAEDDSKDADFAHEVGPDFDVDYEEDNVGGVDEGDSYNHCDNAGGRNSPFPADFLSSVQANHIKDCQLNELDPGSISLDDQTTSFEERNECSSNEPDVSKSEETQVVLSLDDEHDHEQQNELELALALPQNNTVVSPTVNEVTVHDSSPFTKDNDNGSSDDSNNDTYSDSGKNSRKSVGSSNSPSSADCLSSVQAELVEERRQQSEEGTGLEEESPLIGEHGETISQASDIALNEEVHSEEQEISLGASSTPVVQSPETKATIPSPVVFQSPDLRMVTTNRRKPRRLAQAKTPSVLSTVKIRACSTVRKNQMKNDDFLCFSTSPDSVISRSSSPHQYSAEEEAEEENQDDNNDDENDFDECVKRLSLL